LGKKKKSVEQNTTQPAWGRKGKAIFNRKGGGIKKRKTVGGGSVDPG